MPCLNPIRIKNPKYIGLPYDQIKVLHPLISYNGLLPVDYYIEVPCGKCLPCQKKRSNDYVVRLLEHYKTHPVAHFVTLTFAPEFYTTDIDSDHYNKLLQRFLYRLKKKVDVKIDYFITSENGTLNNRFHFHAIIFNLSNTVLEDLPSIWKYGIVSATPLTVARVRYACKYVCKDLSETSNHLRVRTSRYLGLDYVNRLTPRDYNKLCSNRMYNHQGSTLSLPRYYARKIFTEQEQLDEIANQNSERPKEYYFQGRKIETEQEYRRLINREYEKQKELKIVKKKRKLKNKFQNIYGNNLNSD